MKNKAVIIFAKSVLSVFLCVVALFSVSCSGESENNDANHEKVLEAIDLIERAWWERYEKTGIVNKERWYLEIKNTRYIKLSRHDVKTLENVDAVIEFDLYTNFYDTAPYYVDGIPPDSVVVLSDGTLEVCDHSVMNAYRATTYDTDYDRFIEYVTDYDDKYNRIIEP